MPLSNKVSIDEREALDVLDLMRTTVPEEIKQARRVNQEREKILAQAQTEANRLISQAQERVERMLSEDSVRVTAEERAREIIEQARHDAEDVRRGADDYALRMLDRLDAELHRIAGSVQHAIEALHDQPPAAEMVEEQV
ncbi:MAG TPA: ATPase [Chloroflexota bacterium]|nr:ATPase [Chloroflexota bacterium]